MSSNAQPKPELYNCFDCPDDKLCCRLTQEEFQDLIQSDSRLRALVAHLIQAGSTYPKAKQKALSVLPLLS